MRHLPAAIYKIALQKESNFKKRERDKPPIFVYNAPKRLQGTTQE